MKKKRKREMGSDMRGREWMRDKGKYRREIEKKKWKMRREETIGKERKGKERNFRYER